MWIAAWRRFDIVAQGPTERQAIERLFRSVVATVMWNHSDGTPPFSNTQKPNDILLATWARNHKREHGKNNRG